MDRLLYAVAATAALCAVGARAAEPKAVIQGEIEGDLRAAIQRAVGETDSPIENRFEARRRARAAGEAAIAVLRSEGYYAYVVEPDVSETEPPKPIVRITPGPRFVLGEAGLQWQGPPPDTPTAEAVRGALALPADAPARAAEVVAAEGRAMAGLQQHGYPDAEAEPRDVVVDHADHTVHATYRIAAGPLVKLDGLDLTTIGRTNPAWVRRLAPWKSGQVYDPDDVGELERRLLDTGVYDSVTVSLAPVDKATPDGLRPVIVSLGERRHRTLETGASYSTTEGFGLDARWTHYNRLHRADTAALYGRASTLDSRVGLELTLPHWRRPRQTLQTGVAVYRVRTDAYDETGAGVRADITRRYGRPLLLSKSSYVTVGASLDVGRTTELTPGTLTSLGRDLVTGRLLSDVSLDRTDNPLDSHRGWKVSVRAEPTLIVGETNLPYLRVQTQGSYYLPLDKAGHTVVAARLKVGRILNGTIPEVPASQRFYAGGGGSVRGFGYQDVGDELADGTPLGGTTLFEASGEVRRDISSKWGVAAFVDAGAVGSTGPIDFAKLAVGVGLGARYNLGAIPIRIDVATPVANKKGAAAFNVYVSIGQSF